MARTCHMGNFPVFPLCSCICKTSRLNPIKCRGSGWHFFLVSARYETKYHGFLGTNGGHQRRAVVGHAHRHTGARRRAGLRQQVELVAPVVVGFGQPAQRRAGDAAERSAYRHPSGGRPARRRRSGSLPRSGRARRLALQRQHLGKLGVHLQRALVAVQCLARRHHGRDGRCRARSAAGSCCGRWYGLGRTIRPRRQK